MGKYTKIGETPVAYECTKKKCKWLGTEAEKVSIKLDECVSELKCPNCGNNEFYGLRDSENLFVIQATDKGGNKRKVISETMTKEEALNWKPRPFDKQYYKYFKIAKAK